jgi:hypothetical protein
LEREKALDPRHEASCQPNDRGSLDADGRFELLFGGADGKLHALAERAGKPQLLWSVTLGRRVGEPILADIDGDGHGEILVPVEDGRLYCLRGRK